MEHEGVWLRGNLNMHTRRSDGRKSYEEAVALYERAGYDFIAVTDHWVVSEGGETAGGMLLLPGCEYNVGENVREGIVHIVGIGMERAPALVRGQPGLCAQALIDGIRDAGGLAILAHPAWSLNSADRMAALRGLSGVEIVNTTSGFPYNVRPYSGLFVDQLAAQGVLLPCVAADDAHQYEHDALGGWIMVHVRERSQAAILQAIAAGDFYATQGPEAHLTIQGGEAVVRCSPAASVAFFSDSVWNPGRVTQGESITRAICPLQTNETFIRAEVRDSAGRTAYTSPLRIR